MNQKQLNAVSELFGKFIGYVLTLIIFSFLLGWWGEWVLETVFAKDFNFWACVGGIALWSLTPRKITWLMFFSLIVSTIYIWIFL
jgi:hypothetical protein